MSAKQKNKLTTSKEIRLCPNRLLFNEIFRPGRPWKPGGIRLFWLITFNPEALALPPSQSDVMKGINSDDLMTQTVTWEWNGPIGNVRRFPHGSRLVREFRDVTDRWRFDEVSVTCRWRVGNVITEEFITRSRIFDLVKECWKSTEAVVPEVEGSWICDKLVRPLDRLLWT